MGWPQLTSVLQLDDVNFGERWIQVQRMVEGGREIVRSRLPAVITCTRDLNRPRYATFPNMLRAARYQPIIWDKVALNIADDDPNIGLRGSPTIVSKVWAPPRRQRGDARRIDGSDPRKGAAQLLEILNSLGVPAHVASSSDVKETADGAPAETKRPAARRTGRSRRSEAP
jgi:electron transfer flavoprotein beta subunit